MTWDQYSTAAGIFFLVYAATIAAALGIRLFFRWLERRTFRAQPSAAAAPSLGSGDAAAASSPIGGDLR